MSSRSCRAKRRRATSRAYTLIELVIVIAVLGLAGALLVPRLVEPDTLSAQAVVRTIIADLTFAQSDALATQEMRRVQFYPDGSGYCIVRVTDDTFDAAFDAATAEYVNDPLAPAGEFGAYIVNIADDSRFVGISISSVNIDGGSSAITFDQLGGTIAAGGVPGTGGEITVSGPNVQYMITIAPFTGKITVAKLN